MASATQQGDYGLDSPQTVKSMFWRGAWTLAFAIVVFVMNRAEYPAVSARILVVVGLIGVAFVAAGWVMVWSSRVAKFAAREALLDSLSLNGDERVLDVGSGRGFM